MNFPYLPTKTIERSVNELLRKAFRGEVLAAPVDLEVVIFDHLAEEEGLSFNDECDLGEEDGDTVLGAMLPVPGRIEISKHVKEQGPVGRYRFTVAHEIGHWILHRPICLAKDLTMDLFSDAATPTRLVSLKRNVFPGSGQHVPTEEWQANRFAGQLLVPAELLRPAFVQRFGEPPILAERNSARPEPVQEFATWLASVERPVHPQSLADEFQVSVQAMSIALMSRGYVKEDRVLL